MKIAIFFHGLLNSPHSAQVVQECIGHLRGTGLLDESEESEICYNGEPELQTWVKSLVPEKTHVICHGLQSFSENLTIDRLYNWCKSHPGWLVFYGHSKGATHPTTSHHGVVCERWRRCFLHHLVNNWRACVAHLEKGAEMVTCHWMTGLADGTHNIPAGNFLWIKSDFVNTLPSFYERDRIKVSGIAALESRYEAEVFWGNGPRLPIVVDLHPGTPFIHANS